MMPTILAPNLKVELVVAAKPKRARSEAHTPQEKYKSQFQQQAHHIKPLEEMKLLYPVGNFISHYQIKPPEEMKLLYPVGNFVSHYQLKPLEEMKVLYPVGNFISHHQLPCRASSDRAQNGEANGGIF